MNPKYDRRLADRKYYYKNREAIIQSRHKYQKNHPELRKKWNRQYYQTHREEFKKRRKIYYTQHKLEHSARQLASNIPLNDYCQECGATENLCRHHPDYSKPLEIVTLCNSCHHNLHLKHGKC